jgi:hypothetical protein
MRSATPRAFADARFETITSIFAIPARSAGAEACPRCILGARNPVTATSGTSPAAVSLTSAFRSSIHSKRRFRNPHPQPRLCRGNH